MSTRSCIFIGGPADGEIHHIETPVPEQTTVNRFVPTGPFGWNAEVTFQYERHLVIADGVEIYFFLPGDKSMLWAMSMLVGNYAGATESVQ